MEAKEYLKQAYRLHDLIESNEAELKELQLLSVNIPGTDYTKDRVKSTPSTDASYTNIVIKIVDLEKVIKADIEKLLSLKREIWEVIDAVQDNEHKLILRYRYLNFLRWDEISSKMGFSYRTVFRIHEDALKHIKVPKNLKVDTA